MEEDELRDSKAEGKLRETGGSGMMIYGILFLLLLQTLPILIAPLSFSPLHSQVPRKLRKQVEALRQGWDFPPRQWEGYGHTQLVSVSIRYLLKQIARFRE